MSGLSIGGVKGRWIFRILAALVFLYGGVSILSRPQHEVLYNPWIVDAGCHEGMCIRLFILEIGNTGRQDQEEITVEVNNKWFDLIQLPPKAALFGKVSRSLVEQIEGETTFWSIGNLESGKRMDIRFTLGAVSKEKLPQWNDILQTVRASQGTVNRGHPEWTTFSRFLSALFT